MGAGGDHEAVRVRLTVVPMMSDRAMMVKAGEILAEHGALTVNYILGQLADVLSDRPAAEEWRRVAYAVDKITGARATGVH